MGGERHRASGTKRAEGDEAFLRGCRGARTLLPPMRTLYKVLDGGRRIESPNISKHPGGLLSLVDSLVVVPLPQRTNRVPAIPLSLQRLLGHKWLIDCQWSGQGLPQGRSTRILAGRHPLPGLPRGDDRRAPRHGTESTRLDRRRVARHQNAHHVRPTRDGPAMRDVRASLVGKIRQLLENRLILPLRRRGITRYNVCVAQRKSETRPTRHDL